MDSSSEAALALMGLGFLIPLLLSMFLLGGGIYVLYSLSRAASALERLATAAEERLARDVARDNFRELNARTALLGGPGPAEEEPVAQPAGVAGSPVA